MRGLSDHEIFGVREDATERDYKHAFIEVGKRYHPGRLARNVHPDLVRAYMAMFQFLSERRIAIEQRFTTAPKDRAPSSPTR
jgi:hypothetical protein